MSFPVYPTQQYLDRLTALLAADFPATLTNAKCHLYDQDVTPDASSTVDTFHEADYTGYAALPITMTAPSINDQGMVVSKSNSLNFPCAAGVDTVSIYGIFITDSTGDVLLAAQKFDTRQVQGGQYPTSVTGLWRTSEPLSSYGWVDAEN